MVLILTINQPLLNSLDELINLQSLTFDYKFNQPLLNSLDKLVNLLSLSFGGNFNQPLNNLPINLTHLTLGAQYEYEIPVNIKSLELIRNIKHIDYLTNNIVELKLYNDFKFDLVNLPSSIKKLTLNCKYINLVILPNNIEYLKIYKDQLINIKNISQSQNQNLIIEYFD